MTNLIYYYNNRIISIYLIPGFNIEVSHIIMLIIVAFFGISFLKKPSGKSDVSSQVNKIKMII